jgi:hypothetical protein
MEFHIFLLFESDPTMTQTQNTGSTIVATGRITIGAGFDFVAHLARQSAWSEKTFGPGRRTGMVVDHIRKELLEIEAQPDDLEEWCDLIMLALDGAWRAGAGPQQIIDAIVAKQTKNEGRVWPDWRTADQTKAIEHDRSNDGTSTSVESNEAVRALPKFDRIDWGEISRRGLIERINRAVMHRIGLAVYWDTETGSSGGALVSPDGKWCYPEDAENLPTAAECADEWYLQDTRSYTGNDVMWWAKDGKGYTTDVNKAHVYGRAEAFQQAAMRGCDKAWPKAYIDGKTRPAVDMQYINHADAIAATQGEN